MDESGSSPRYEKIALDIANSIYKGQYEEGEKFTAGPPWLAHTMFHLKQ